jgi:hypothetical protein
MVIVTDGKNLVRDLICAGGTCYVNQAGLGTVSSTPLESQTGLNNNTNLGTPAATIKSVSVDKSDKQAIFSYTLLSTEGTGNTFREFGLNSSGTAKLFNRQVFYDLYHGTIDEINITQAISIV